MNEEAEMNQTAIKITKTVPRLHETEIMVVGAGPAGCAAAVTAARMGCKTLIVERYGFAGGAAVTQTVPVVLSQNGADFQGIWHEFMREMKKNGLVSEMVRGEQCDYWLSSTYSPESAKHAWDALLTEAGVEVLYHAMVTGIQVSDEREVRVILETRRGSFHVKARVVIDCTGDGYVCAQAGLDFELGNGDGPVSQAATKMFRLIDGVKPELVLNTENLATLQEAYEEAIRRGEYDSPVITSGYLLKYITSRAGKHLPDGTLLFNAVRMIDVDSLDPWSLSRAEIEGRRYALQCARFIASHVPANDRAKLLDTSMELGVRASRRILGEAYLTRDDVVTLRKFPDGIARGRWMFIRQEIISTGSSN